MAFQRLPEQGMAMARVPAVPAAPAPAPALDPRGIVPVNRVQPLATDGNEAQRMMENRLGSMPPSSFAGSGNAFVPVDRAMPAPALARPAQMTDMANAEMATNRGTAPLPAVSAEALATMRRAQGYGAPRPIQTTGPAPPVRQFNANSGLPDGWNRLSPMQKLEWIRRNRARAPGLLGMR